MIIIKCDACKRELGQFEVRQIDVPEHLLKVSAMAGSYVDKEGNIVNHKTSQKDLCIKCYNQVMNAVVNQISIISKGVE